MPMTADMSEIKAEFDELVAKWTADTRISSSSTQIIGHECYQRVIAMGATVVPLVLREMLAGHLHWGWALAEITGENPAEGTDSPLASTEAWLAWGRSRGLVAPDLQVTDGGLG